MKRKIKFYGDKSIDFHDKEIPKVDFNLTCSAVISLDSALNKDGNHYPQKVMIKNITEDIEIFSDDLMSLVISFNERLTKISET